MAARVGQYVQVGTQLMAVVPLHAVYVVANYKETQLTNVRPGQAADIEIQANEILRMRARLNEIYVEHTGKTLEENGLGIIEVITDSAARLVVNRASYQLKAEAVGQLIKSLEVALLRRANGD